MLSANGTLFLFLFCSAYSNSVWVCVENCYCRIAFLGVNKSQADRDGSLVSPQTMLLMQEKGLLNVSGF